MRWLADIRRHPFRSVGPVALAVMALKCLVCVFAYIGVGAALGLKGKEICGGTARSVGSFRTVYCACRCRIGSHCISGKKIVVGRERGPIALIANVE